jgi:hypothetical protein
MTDGFEDDYGLDPTDPSDASDNPDGDPHNNREEFVADTNPTDSNDYLRITDIFVASPAAVHFVSSSNRWYTMEGCSNLLDGPWSAVPGAGPRIGVGGADFLSDTNEPSIGPFYRLEVGLP